MDTITELGRIAIGRPESVIEARNKIRIVARALTDTVTATRLGTATSEICRSLTQRNDTAVLTVQVERQARKASLSLVFEDQEPLPSTPIFERFFDEVIEVTAESGTHAVRAVTYLPEVVLQGQMNDLSHLQRIIEEKSRDELMHEVQEKNRQLEHHQKYLEQTVRERTEELSDALSLISDSINYASRIQRAILPPRQLMAEAFGEHFVIWEPRDVVGGDIFWCRRSKNSMLIILADCTGHGVPGAFMTLISNDALDNTQAELSELDPGAIIRRMHWWIQKKLSRDEGGKNESNDGLELGVCYFDVNIPRRLAFSGARQSLFCIVDGEVNEIKGGKFGIGYADVSENINTETHLVEIQPGMAFYLASDGIIDQIGGVKRRAFGKRRLIEMLLSIQDRSMAEQRSIILERFAEFQGDEKQRDDVTLIGFKNIQG
jgi:serine phosphatase RsbU (regulator of sigma subunit)